MGNRVGYRIRDGDQVSDLIRKQCQTDDIKRVVTDVAKTLVTGSDGEGAIGEGGATNRATNDTNRVFDHVEQSNDRKNIGIKDIPLRHTPQYKSYTQYLITI